MFGKKDDDGDLVKIGDNPGQNMGLVLMEELWDKYMRTHMWPLPKCDMEKDKLYGPASDMNGCEYWMDKPCNPGQAWSAFYYAGYSLRNQKSLVTPT